MERYLLAFLVTVLVEALVYRAFYQLPAPTLFGRSLLVNSLTQPLVVPSHRWLAWYLPNPAPFYLVETAVIAGEILLLIWIFPEGSRWRATAVALLANLITAAISPFF